MEKHTHYHTGSTRGVAFTFLLGEHLIKVVNNMDPSSLWSSPAASQLTQSYGIIRRRKQKMITLSTPLHTRLQRGMITWRGGFLARGGGSCTGEALGRYRCSILRLHYISAHPLFKLAFPSLMLIHGLPMLVQLVGNSLRHGNASRCTGESRQVKADTLSLGSKCRPDE